MFYREVWRALGIYLLLFSLIILIPLGLAFYYEYFTDTTFHPQPHSTGAFFWTFLVTALCGLLLRFFGTSSHRALFQKEGILVVALVWILTPLFASLPFYFEGTLDNPLQAYFETVSGLTTTGSTVLQAKHYSAEGTEIPIETTIGGTHPKTYSYYGNVTPVRDPATGKVVAEGIEAVGRALLFWRSFLQFLGGVGIVVMFISILPSLGMVGKMLFHTESTGPIKSTMTPRITQTAFYLWMINIILNILCVFFLMITNKSMPFFDALTIAFSAVSTGGFSIKNENIAAYHNEFTEWVTILFMIAGGTNFVLYVHMFKGKLFRVFQIEFLLYLGFIVVGSLVAAWYINGTPHTPMSGQSDGYYHGWQSLRYGTFQVVSAITTTGFATANYEWWPFAAQAIMLVWMYVGGMTGSTSGGMKVLRHYILFQDAKNKIESLYRTKMVRQVRISGEEGSTSPEVVRSVHNFFWIAVAFCTVTTLFYIFNGMDHITAFGITACSVNNVGLAFGAADPTASFAFLSDFDLALSSLQMLFGRLEYMIFLTLLFPSFWKET